MKDGISGASATIPDVGGIPRPVIATKLIWYPLNFRYEEVTKFTGEGIRYYLPYGIDGKRWWRAVASSLYWPVKLCLTPRGRLGWEVFIACNRRDSFWALTLTISAKLRGIPLVVHDYRFLSKSPGFLCRLFEFPVQSNTVKDMSAPHLIFYQNFRKKRAVPKVIVYGDHEDLALWSVVKRTCNLVKQKYPRTEFVIPFMVEPDDDLYRIAKGSIITKSIQSESDLLQLFEQADILVLLSKGGFNDVFSQRAETAGYPVIINGAEYGLENMKPIYPIAVSYNNPVAMAEAIIKLVDNDKYYQSFSLFSQVP